MSASEQGASRLGTASKGPSGRKGRPRGTGTLDLVGGSEELVLFLECWGIEELICSYETGELLMLLLLPQLLRGEED